MAYRIDIYIGSDNGSRKIGGDYLDKITDWASRTCRWCRCLESGKRIELGCRCGCRLSCRWARLKDNWKKYAKKDVGRPEGLEANTRNRIVKALSSGPKKFGELHDLTKTNKGILKKHLKELADETAVERKVLPVKGHHVQYSLVDEPYTLSEHTISFETPWKEIRPYERYYLPTREEEEEEKQLRKKLGDIGERIEGRDFWIDYLKPLTEKGKKIPLREALLFYYERMGGRTQRLDSVAMKTAWYLLHRDLREQRICMECFENDRFSIIVPEADSRMTACPACGVVSEKMPTIEEAKHLIVKGAVGRDVAERMQKLAKKWKAELGGHPMDEQRFLKMLKGSRVR